MKLCKTKELLLLFLILVLCVSCASNQHEEEIDDVIAFTQQFEQSIQNRDSDFIYKPIDFNAICGFMAKKYGFPRGPYRQILCQGLKNNLILGDVIIQMVHEKKGVFNFTRYYFDGRFHHTIFKVQTEESLSYFDLQLYKSEKDGRIRVLDIYTFASGESISSISLKIGRIFKTKFNNGLSHVEEFLEDWKTLGEVDRWSTLGVYEIALEHYERISTESKNRDFFRKVKITLLTHTDAIAARQELENYKELFPKDRKFIIFMEFLLSNNFDDFLHFEEELEALVGKPMQSL